MAVATRAGQDPMPGEAELVVYKASAGSGKTFTLAVEYISLLVGNPQAYCDILAVTFTNKATAEMKERILTQLYGIWTADPASDAYLQEVRKKTGQGETAIRKAAGVAMNLIIHDYSHFRVETIDSFSLAVMHNLARELEIGTNLNIELNSDEALSDAVDSVVEHLQGDSPALGWLTEYIDERIAEDRRWNPIGDIKKFGRQIFNEQYIEKGESLRLRLADEGQSCISSYRATLRAEERKALASVAGYHRQLVAILATRGLTPENLKGGRASVASYFRKMEAGQIDNSIVNKTVESCLDSAGGWATKTSPHRQVIADLAETRLIPLLEEAEAQRARANRTLNSCRLSLECINDMRLLTLIDTEVREMNGRRGRFLLSSVNALLHRLVGDDDTSFVFEKLGASISHVMIDEFQDTSGMQWGNFRLLLLEGLARGKRSLIVGDVKQSIYRWRSGDWNILNSLGGRFGAFPIRVETLGINRRSATNIVRFNNGVFSAACRVLNGRYEAEMKEPCQTLLNAYADVAQLTPHSTPRGMVRVSLLPADSKETAAGQGYEDTTLRELAGEVERLVARGIRERDIAILVRKNASIPLIAEYFSTNTEFRIVSDDAFRLCASTAVRMIVDAMRLLSAPDDGVTLAQLAIAYQSEVEKKETDINTLLLMPRETLLRDFLPPEYARQMDRLAMMPLYELAEKLLSIFRLTEIPGQDGYLCTFFDTVMDYSQSSTAPGLAEFLAQWDDTLRLKALPSGDMPGIRILSIHKSKGLEYQTVLVPFCDWNMEGEVMMGNTLWCEPREAPYDGLPLVAMNYRSQMAESIYRDDYLRERLQLWVDSLNLLYVAFTRAKDNLIVWGKGGKRGIVSEVLLQALEDMQNTESGRLFPMERKEGDPPGSVSFCGGEIAVPAERKEAEGQANRLLATPRQAGVELASHEASIEFRQSNRSAQFIGGEGADGQRYIDQGLLLHSLFSQIGTAADIEPALARLRFEGLVESAEQEERIRHLTTRAMANPLVQDWYSGTWTLYNERSIIFRRDGAAHTRRPDRVMVRDGRAVVLDFKFGKRHPDHHTQVREYMELMAGMGYGDVRGYLWYVYENEVEEVSNG